MALEDVGVRFITEGLSQFKSSIEKADAALDKFGKSATDAAKKSESSFAGMERALNTIALDSFINLAERAVSGLITVGKAVKGLADDFMNYAFQVKDFGRIIGATPEEASRLIQVADDVRLSVGSMTVAMRTAITKGYEPTIEGLGQIADAYMSIQDPIERSKFLVSTFGRSGLEMAKLMEKGSAGIRAMSAAIDDGLIVDQKGIEKAQAYYDALDALNDRWTALRLQAGAIVLPIIIQGLQEAPKVIDDAMNVIDMFNVLQKGMEKGVVKPLGVFGPESTSYLNQYLTAEKSATQIISEVNQKIKEQDQANKLAVSGMQILNNEWRTSELLLGTFPSKYQATTDVIWGANNAIETMATNAWESTDAFKSMTATMDQDVVQAAQRLSEQKLSVEMGLEFKAPDIASQMQNLMKSIDWKAAGGEALTTFMQGFATQAAPMTDEQKKKVAAQIGAVDIALNVKTGDITKWEGITKIKELSGMNTTDAQALIDKISGMTPPDISAYLNQIMQLGAPETTAAAATNTANLSTSISDVGTSASTNQTLMMSWSEGVKEVGANTKVAKDETGFLSEKMIGTGEAALAHASEVSGWSGLIETLGTTTEETADYMTEVNTQIKNLPAQKTVDIYINVHGSVPNIDDYDPTPNPGKHAAGGPTYANTLYLVGERGPELFIPDVSGTMIPNGPTMSILDNLITIIPMAKGGKMTKAQEKAQNKKARAQIERRASKFGMGLPEGTEAASGTETILDRGNDVLDALKARETIAWDMVKSSVAEYNYLIKSGVSPGEMIDKKRMIDQSVQEAQALTKLRIESERQVTLMESQADTAEGMENTSTWLGKLITQFKDFFDLLTSTAAQEALKTLNPLISASPAPLAVGLSQIGREMAGMSATSIPRFTESIAQLASPSRIYQNQSSTYNVNVPITATIRSDADMQTLAYQIAKVFVRETR